MSRNAAKQYLGRAFCKSPSSSPRNSHRGSLLQGKDNSPLLKVSSDKGHFAAFVPVAFGCGIQKTELIPKTGRITYLLRF